MMIRWMITLSEKEAKEIVQMAYAELREPRDQVRYMLQQELVRRGLLPKPPAAPSLPPAGVPPYPTREGV